VELHLDLLITIYVLLLTNLSLTPRAWINSKPIYVQLFQMDTRLTLKFASASLLQSCLHDSGNAIKVFSCLNGFLVLIIQNFRTTPILWTEDPLSNHQEHYQMEPCWRVRSNSLLYNKQSTSEETLVSYSISCVSNRQLFSNFISLSHG